MKLYLMLIATALTCAASYASESQNPNAEAMKNLILQYESKIIQILQAEQKEAAIVISLNSIRCLGLEHSASPIGVCMLEAKYADDSVFFLYGITISFPNGGTDGSGDYDFSARLIELAPY